MKKPINLTFNVTKIAEIDKFFNRYRTNYYVSSHICGADVGEKEETAVPAWSIKGTIELLERYVLHYPRRTKVELFSDPEKVPGKEFRDRMCYYGGSFGCLDDDEIKELKDGLASILRKRK